MTTGLQNQHKNEKFQAASLFPLYLTVQQDDLANADQVYVYIPVKCNLVQVYSTVNTQTAGVSTCTVKAPDGSAVGTIDSMASVTNTSIEAGEVLEIENDATPTAGAATFLIVLGP